MRKVLLFGLVAGALYFLMREKAKQKPKPQPTMKKAIAAVVPKPSHLATTAKPAPKPKPIAPQSRPVPVHVGRPRPKPRITRTRPRPVRLVHKLRPRPRSARRPRKPIVVYRRVSRHVYVKAVRVPCHASRSTVIDIVKRSTPCARIIRIRGPYKEYMLRHPSGSGYVLTSHPERYKGYTVYKTWCQVDVSYRLDCACLRHRNPRLFRIEC